METLQHIRCCAAAAARRQWVVAGRRTFEELKVLKKIHVLNRHGSVFHSVKIQQLSTSTDDGQRGSSARTAAFFAAFGLASSALSVGLYDCYRRQQLKREGLECYYVWDNEWDVEWRARRWKEQDVKNAERVSGADSIAETDRDSQKDDKGAAAVDDSDDTAAAKNQWWTLQPKASRQILLIRHGQYCNVDKKDDAIQGLTDMGKRQAHLTGERLAAVLQDKNIVAVRHSTMKRAHETAEIIASYLPNAPISPDPLLAEGIPCYIEPQSEHFVPTEAEIRTDGPRIASAFEHLFYRPRRPPVTSAASSHVASSGLQSQMASPKVEYEVIVCHGNVIRYFFCRGLQFPTTAWLRLATFNCGVTWLSVDDKGRVSAREFGNVGHLPADMVSYH